MRHQKSKSLWLTRTTLSRSLLMMLNMEREGQIRELQVVKTKNMKINIIFKYLKVQLTPSRRFSQGQVNGVL